MRPPTTEAELIERAMSIAGRTLGELSIRLKRPLPKDGSSRAKGIVGQLLEKALGASAGNRAEPDFVEIGVELKSLPVSAEGRPKESTFVATLPLIDVAETDFEQSPVWHKLERVLWVPVEAQPSIPFAERRVGAPILWSPSEAQRAVLQEDYERVAALVLEGRPEEITGYLGTYLQVRPKAADGSVRTRTADLNGELAWTGPKGFYLRTQFTTQVLASL